MSENTLTGLIPIIYRALNRVAREQCGAIASVYKNTDAAGAAVNQTIRYNIVPSFGTPGDVTPAAYAPDATGRTIGYGDMTIEASKYHSFPFTGEEIGQLGTAYAQVLEDSFLEAFRSHSNAIESFILTKAYKKASRAIGTAGTAPFASDTKTISFLRKILVDNGAPTSNLRLVINGDAAYNLRNIANLIKLNEAGDDMYRTGNMGNIYGFKISESGGVPVHTAGTGTGYNINLVAGYAVGSTSVVLEAGSGTIVAGDVFNNSQSGRDSNLYVVKTALTGSTVVLQNPGIRKAWVNDDTVAIQAAYTANLAFDQNAIHLVTRPPLVPPGGDAAAESMTMSDPVTGLAFRIAIYKQFHQQSIEVSIAYGGDVVKPEFVATLMG